MFWQSLPCKSAVLLLYVQLDVPRKTRCRAELDSIQVLVGNLTLGITSLFASYPDTVLG